MVKKKKNLCFLGDRKGKKKEWLLGGVGAVSGQGA